MAATWEKYIDLRNGKVRLRRLAPAGHSEYKDVKPEAVNEWIGTSRNR